MNSCCMERCHSGSGASLVVVLLYLEEALRMVADGAYGRSLLADNDVSAVAALPDAVAVA